jgi:hypothetical protein
MREWAANLSMTSLARGEMGLSKGAFDTQGEYLGRMGSAASLTCSVALLRKEPTSWEPTEG